MREVRCPLKGSTRGYPPGTSVGGVRGGGGGVPWAETLLPFFPFPLDLGEEAW